jgi:segregation and condensation protein B
VEKYMTEKSQQVEDTQESEDVQETVEAQEVHQEQDALEEEQVQGEEDVLEPEGVQEAQDDQDDESQITDEAEPDVPQPEQEITTTVESVVEAVLFASDEPLTEARLANIVETNAKQIRQQVKNLNDKYKANNNAFRIEQIAGGYQMLTLSPYNHWLKKLLRARSDNKLSPAAMETLAIIAYKQPVIRADIEAIRGVAVGEVIRSLSYKGLVKIVGRAEVLGRPMLYGTTKKFLEVFGLNTLKDLPKVQELREPSS